MVRKIFLFIVILFLLSCAHITRSPVRYDYGNYDRMFAAAISKGTQLAYAIDDQNKEYGLIKMSRKVGNGTYSIQVKFGPDSFSVAGGIDTDLINPFIDKDAQAIEEAIIKAGE